MTFFIHQKYKLCFISGFMLIRFWSKKLRLGLCSCQLKLVLDLDDFKYNAELGLHRMGFGCVQLKGLPELPYLVIDGH
ncbi:hypothetical protein VNO77_22962 [Canavalia gladiata]|uniref:Uncharacterized protein n=1 Tax=Canavalia gladiata TaxID=3824 RepID=A0AAN9QB29_CANGL